MQTEILIGVMLSGLNNYKAYSYDENQIFQPVLIESSSLSRPIKMTPSDFTIGA